MTTMVLDASAVLAVLLQEPGADRAQACLSGALCTTVNLTEIMATCADKGLSLAVPDALMRGYGVRYVDFDKDLALAAALLRPSTRHKGLSLGDRACLALAIRENATAITTDRAWADLDVGCHIEVIR